MPAYIYQQSDWPQFTWDAAAIGTLLADVRHRQGRLLGRMENLGFNLQAEANLQTLTLDVLKSGEIEGEVLNADQVRSSIARRLGLDFPGMVESIDRNVEGFVEMMLDATQQFDQPLTDERLFSWHAALFPTGRSGMHRIVTGNYRNNAKEDPMQVVSGSMGRETVHFKAPAASALNKEMDALLRWFNSDINIDPVVKAALAHLWFVIIHPFDDGNGRMARAITDMQLSRADNSSRRFYSISAQIKLERKQYYQVLEDTQKDSLDVTTWLEWFLHCLGKSINNTEQTLQLVLQKARFWERHAGTPFNARQQTMLNKLLDGFYGNLTTAKWASITKTSQDTANRDINDLLGKRILDKAIGGGRSTSYVLKGEL